ncbi:F-type Na(+)-transporting ATPase subunit gamma [Amphibacillus xylanus NBRC 15112]|uniref:ATP synthase gamma chain n=2 Tax=Amphibacillus xylanus TaxID=1449 RepID=K0IZ29_AMPXN|nr:F-type Na(+)-transporting ATPase subunit gamma [Amphibacillus xylanus NBRC 15112]
MTSMRDIKQRIENVRSTEQIIRAMDMVASTKLQKARRQLEGVRPIYGNLKRVVEEIGNLEEVETHPFYYERKVKNTLYIIITSDRGLSGSYNANILSESIKHMNNGKNEKILVVGSKGNDYLKKREKNIIRKITDIADSQVYYGTENLAKWLSDLYLSGEVDEVFVAYTRFENVLSYIPHVERLLPVATGVELEDNNRNNEKKYEPDLATFIDQVMPLYLHMSLFRAFSESHTSEQAARMVNMDAAGNNASDLIKDLTSMYNRKRQAAITQELSEIVGSANFLSK